MTEQYPDGLYLLNRVIHFFLSHVFLTYRMMEPVSSFSHACLKLKSNGDYHHHQDPISCVWLTYLNLVTFSSIIWQIRTIVYPFGLAMPRKYLPAQIKGLISVFADRSGQS